MVKIWKMNECDWVAAKTLESAKQCLADTVANGVVDEQFEDEFIDDPRELTEDELNKFKLGDEDAHWQASQAADDQTELSWDDYMDEHYYSKRPTFKQALASRLEKGDIAPFFFASTEY